MNEIDAYKQFSNILNSLQPYSIDLSLDRIKECLNKIGNPQNSFKSIIVGGTNGKGSVCQFLTDTLMYAGYIVGTYTSPHLIQINERFRIINKTIPYNQLLKYAKQIQFKQNVTNLTYFEFLTTLAFLAFRDLKIDIAVLEVGMGGEYDAVNTVNPILSIITRISLDHEEYLGKTHKDIAKTKSKIIKNIGVVGKNSKTVIETIKKNTQAELFFVDDSYLKKADSMETYMNSKSAKENLASALLAIDILKKEYKMNLSYKPLKKTLWPGRFEIIKSGNKTFILDGAHNKSAVFKLVLSLQQYKTDKILIFSALKQKDWKNNLKILIPHFTKIILTPISQHKLSESLLNIQKFIGKDKKTVLSKNTNEAVITAMKEEEKVVVITGSLYLIGEAKASPINTNFLP